jgi:hypothetical protein
MRITGRKTRFSLNAALGLTLGLALVAAIATLPGPARAEDDSVPIDTKILRGVLHSLGLKRPGEGEITYRERAPLVIPPDKDLPPPQAPGAAVANNPAWPKDPDIARAKIGSYEDKNYGTTEQMEHEENALSPAELTPGAGRWGTTRRTAHAGSSASSTDPEHSRLMPDQLGFKGTLFGTMFGAKDDPDSVRFTGEPARTSLTEPPPGYQVPSPDQPYGLGKEATASKADNSYVTRNEINE